MCGGMQVFGCIEAAAKMPFDRESSWQNTIVTVTVTVFLLKLQEIQEGCFGKLLLHSQAGFLYYGWT